jgi:Protein of unknown function DUF262
VSNPTTQRTQLQEQRLRVDFDTYDVSVDELLRRVSHQRIDIDPVYQRQFRWEFDRQSKLIESVFLGIPIPPLFMATNKLADAVDTWEVVDGLQRLLSLTNFAGDDDTRKTARLEKGPLKLSALEKLSTLNGNTFFDLSEDLRSSLLDRPLKVIVLNDKSDLQVRYDLFERLNTGGIELTDQEIRECVFRGTFMDLLSELAQSEAFKTLVRLPSARWKDGTPQEMILRFFAYTEGYLTFDHLVGEFLGSFTKYAHGAPQIETRRRQFFSTFGLLERTFPHGITTRAGRTPIVLFEALTAGAALALEENPNITQVRETSWVESAELRSLTTGATNSKPRVQKRIELCRDQFLANAIYR